MNQRAVRSEDNEIEAMNALMIFIPFPCIRDRVASSIILNGDHLDQIEGKYFP